MARARLIGLDTIVHQGAGQGVVVGTGSAIAIAFGAVAVGLQEHQAKTAFQVGPRAFSGLLVKGRRADRVDLRHQRLVTIEHLGNIEVLFTDKTGTLTCDITV
jgi:hypothetical protein